MDESKNNLDPNAPRTATLRIMVNAFETAAAANVLLSINTSVLGKSPEEIEQAIESLGEAWKARAADHIAGQGTFKTLNDLFRVVVLGLPSGVKGKRPVREGGEE